MIITKANNINDITQLFAKYFSYGYSEDNTNIDLNYLFNIHIHVLNSNDWYISKLEIIDKLVSIIKISTVGRNRISPSILIFKIM